MIKKPRIVNRTEMAYREIENIPHMPEFSSTLNVRASQRNLGARIAPVTNKYLGNITQTSGTLGSCFRRNERKVVLVERMVETFTALGLSK